MHNHTTNSSNIAGERIRIKNAFGNSTKYVCSDNFLYARIENNFGAMTVYFDNALIQQGSADININNDFGTMNLYLPKNWQIKNNVNVAFGAFRENGKNQISDYPVVNITGSTAFGTVNVYYL